MIIDVHAHHYPVEYLKVIGLADVPNREHAPLASLDLTERVALMDEVGVDAQVLSVSATHPYFAEEERSLSAARLVNDLYAEACRDHPGRLYAFGALPLPHIDSALDEARRCLDELDMVGIVVGTTVLGRHLDDPVLLPLYELLSERETALFVHPTGAMHLGDLTLGRLNTLVGFYLEDTVALVHLAGAQIPQRFPGMKIIVPHFGGALITVAERLVRAAPSVWSSLQSIWFDTVHDRTDVASCGCACLGTDRLLYGSDFPYSSKEEYTGRLERLRSLPLTPEQLSQVLGDRASSLLGLRAGV